MNEREQEEYSYGPIESVSLKALSGELKQMPTKSERPKREKFPTLPTLEVKVGEVLTDKRGDKYVLRRKLGEGGMGAVFEAKDERTGMTRAIKFMNNHTRGIPDAIRRFKREIRVLGQMNNPFILSAIDVTHFEIDGEQIVGFITAFVNGPTIDQEIQKKGLIEPKRLVTLATEIAMALESLRKAGIVHRDLKPQNVFLEQMPDGEQLVRIGDFGIVGFEFESDQTLSQSDQFSKMRDEQLTGLGYAVGTPAYMSPEATSGALVDHRSDLYSLGILLYNMAIGRLPFNEGSAHVIMRQHVKDVPNSFARHGAKDMPEWIEDITLRLLEKDPKDRFQTAAAVFVALKSGVAKDYPELLNQIPFIWDQ
jgi:serine/threonine-protein kinase